MKLPRDVSGHRLVAALRRRGFHVDHQVGSHLTLRHPDLPGKKVIVPVHGARPLKPGTLSRILKEAGLTGDDLRSLR